MSDIPGSFQPLRALATASIILLVVQVAASTLGTGVDWAGWQWEPAWNSDAAELSTFGLLLGLALLATGLTTLGTYVATVVVFLIWLHRASSNLRNLGVQLRVSPGWSVGWWFIPFANLVKPFHAVHDVYKQSAHLSQPEAAASTSVLGWWWAGWLISNIAGQASLRLALHGGEQFNAVAMWIDLANVFVTILAAALLIVIIRRITAWQADIAPLVAEAGRPHPAALEPWQTVAGSMG